MSLLTDLSGVNAAQSDIDTVGNNIANVDTTGFKISDAQFAALYGSVVPTTPGQGVTTADLAQNFSQGTISHTGNPLDVAINGNGFFQLQSGSGLVYSRDGAFQINTADQLVNAGGDQVLGFAPTAAGGAATASGSLQPIQISQANVAPVATSTLTMAVNLPSSDQPINTTTTAFSPTNPQSYNESSTTTVYDSLGTPLSLTTFYTQVAGSGSPNQWQTNWELTTQNGTQIATGAGPTLTFNSNGTLTTGTGTVTASKLPDGAAALNIAENFTGTTLSGLAFNVSSVADNGSAGGQLTGVEISSEGVVTGQYSNGSTQVFGTIALANFVNPQGLIPMTGNVWQASAASGAPTPGAPGTGTLGQLESGALEGSNADLSTQLVNLITAQQAYQANVQSINIEQQNFQRLLTIQ
ncbi:MAG: flagellar hook protein FlgE [Alphaproteobacteria bacterium]|nr:flagellar hook protein FlgE [Alphaproteobacteria bacterium]